MGRANLSLCLCNAITTPTPAARATFLANVRLNGSSAWFALVLGCMLPNGSRLSCGRLDCRRKAAGRSPCPVRGTTLRFPLKRSPPASFKRLLGRSIGLRTVARDAQAPHSNHRKNCRKPNPEDLVDEVEGPPRSSVAHRRNRGEELHPVSIRREGV